MSQEGKSQEPVVRIVATSHAASWLFQVLQEEDDKTLDNLDGKGFGRPVTQQGIEDWLGPVETPNGKYCSAISFLTYQDNQTGVHCGIKTGVVHQYKDGIKVGYLVTVYSATNFQKQGLATAAVKAATSHAFSKLQVKEVAFLLADRNTAAQAFYKRIGFGPTAINFLRGGIPMTLWTISNESFNERYT